MKNKVISLTLTMMMIFMNVSVSAFPTGSDENSQEKQVLEENTASSVLDASQEVSEQAKKDSEPEILPEATASPTPSEFLNDGLFFKKSLTAGGIVEVENEIIFMGGDNTISGNTSLMAYTVADGATAVITLDNCYLYTAEHAPLTIGSGANVTLKLKGTSTIESNASGYAGIYVKSGATLTIESDNGVDADGVLNVSSAERAAAIGANRSGAAYDNSGSCFGTIIINSGTINATANGTTSAAIGDGQACTKGGTIEINGGIVTAVSTAATAPGSAIGAAAASTSRTVAMNITINDGWVKAETAGTHAIGGGTKLNIEINGGYIYGKGKTNTIGGTPALFEINGGSIASDSPNVMTTGFANKIPTLRRITLKMPEGSGMTNKRIKIDNNSLWSSPWYTYTDETGDGQMYVYVSSVVSGITATCIDGGAETKYSAAINATDSEYTLEPDTASCTCTEEDGAAISISDDTVPSEIVVNNFEKDPDKQEKILLKDPLFTKTTDCEAQSHTVSDTTYEIVDPQPDSRASIVKEGNNQYLVVKYAEGDEEITIKVTSSINDKEYTAQKTVNLSGTSLCHVYLDDGNIEISEDGDNMKVKVGSTTYSGIPRTDKIYIEQKNGAKENHQLDRYISVIGVSPTLNLKNINIHRNAYYALRLGVNVKLTLELEDENRFYSVDSAISGDTQTSELIIGGSGSLRSESAKCAGIGAVKKLTINSGTITAYGGDDSGSGYGSAGIGADSEHTACEVEINGGYVYAYGAGDAAGIGGSGHISTNYATNNITINGGMVYAVSKSTNQSRKSGMGIGYGFMSGGNSDGNVVINNGSVYTANGYATLADAINYKSNRSSSNKNPINSSGDDVYLITLGLRDAEGNKITGKKAVEYSVTNANEDDTDSRIQTSTDDNGNLYLYMKNTGETKRWIRVYDGTDIYYYYTAIENKHTNSGLAELSPAKKSITSFSIPGQTEVNVDNDNHTVDVKIPAGITIDAITPTVEIQGAEHYPADADLNAVNSLIVTAVKDTDDSILYYTAPYVVVGHDLSKQEYTIKLIPDENSSMEIDDDGKLILDISKYSIKIKPDSLIYGGTQYNVNELGYRIIGTTTTNTLSIEGAAADDVIPPIVLDNVNITYSGTAAALGIIEAKVNVKVEGNCTITSSASGNAINLRSYNYGASLNITSDDPVTNMLNINGSNSATAIYLSNNQMSVTDVAYKITAGTNQKSIDGTGNAKFYTNSHSYANIIGSSSSLRPMLKGENGEEDTALYQVSATFNFEGDDLGTNENVCSYKEKRYYIDDTHTLCIMMPAGEHNIDAIYRTTLYKGKAEVKDKDVSITLHTIHVSSITPDKVRLTYHGGTIKNTITGTYIVGNVRMAYKDPVSGNFIMGEPTYEDENNNAIATIKLPYNETMGAVVHSLYYTDNGVEFVDAGITVIVEANTSKCSIENLELEGQIRSEFEVRDNVNYFEVYMPFDHILGTQYVANVIEFNGKSVSPAANTLVTFIKTDTLSYASFTVTAADSSVTENYFVRVHTESRPNISHVEFKGDDELTSNGGTVKVILRGNRLGNIAKAEDPDNRNVYIYLNEGKDDELCFKAEAQEDNGTVIYTADVVLPENESYLTDKRYTVSAKIGGTETKSPWGEFSFSNSTLVVPRAVNESTDILQFKLQNQISSNISLRDGTIEILMPFNADLSSITIDTIMLADPYFASYALYDMNDTLHQNQIFIWDPIDWSNGVECIVMAQGTSRKTYNITVEKQAAPVITNIDFTQPTEFVHNPGTITMTVHGQNLESAEYSVDGDSSVVLSLCNANGAVAVTTYGNIVHPEEGDCYYTFEVDVPDNLDYVNAKEYILKVVVCGEDIFTNAENLIVPRNHYTTKEITVFNLVEGQTFPITKTENDEDGTGTINIEVPYNTDLRTLKPIKLGHNGVKCEPSAETVRDFNQPLTYTITSDNNIERVYTVTVSREGTPGILSSQTLKTPQSYNDVKDITFNINGNFIPEKSDANGPKDEVVIYAKCGEDITYGTMDYGEFYGGKATGTLILDENTTFEDKMYNIYVKINGVDSQITSITVPARTKRIINSFKIDGASGDIVNYFDEHETDNYTGTIDITVPYETDLNLINPEIQVEEGDICKKETDFALTDTRAVYSATYSVTTPGDPDPRIYTVNLTREGKPDINSVTVTNSADFNGNAAKVEFSGTFFDGAKVYAVAEDGTEIEGTVTFAEGSASAVFDMPVNEDTDNDAVYTLKYVIDGFDSNEGEITFKDDLDTTITVPRRTKRTITKFVVNGEYNGNIVNNDENTSGTINVTVPYETDLSSLTLDVELDGDNYEQTEAFKITENRAVYSAGFSVTTENDAVPRIYTVYIVREGKPTVNSVTVTNTADFNGKGIKVDFDGTFFDGAKVYAVAEDGTEIEGTVTFAEGSASAVFETLKNESFESDAEYTLKFNIDGFESSGSEIIFNEVTGKIIVPRRTTRQITEFMLPDDIQEGETRIEGTDIYIDVPYHLDIKSVVPKTVVYDADTIEPAVDAALDFSDLKNPVKYTMSSLGDENVTYTVHITRIGEDPYLKTMTADKQAKQTVYDGDSVHLVLRANANIKQLEPILDFVGLDYSPHGPQDFSQSKKEPVEYTIFNKYGVEHKYYVTIEKQASGGGSALVAVSTPTPTPKPTPTVESTAEPTKTPTPEPTAKTKPYIHGYIEDDIILFRPDANITRAEIATIISILDESFDEFHQYEASFSDVNPDMWYANYINFAVSKGCISGYEDGTCRPENMITRAEFASLIARYIGIDTPTSDNLFVDIDSFGWCRNEINALARAGILNGYNNNEFRPENFVTRAETVAIINRIFDRKMTDEIASKLTCPFADITSEHWAYNDALLASCEY